MPFELGLDIGCKIFNSREYSDKKHLILEGKKYEYQKGISDVSNSDTKSHDNEPIKIVEEVRNWFVNNGMRNVPGPEKIWGEYTDFIYLFKAERINQGFSEEQIYRIPITEYIEYAKRWLNHEL